MNFLEELRSANTQRNLQWAGPNAIPQDELEFRCIEFAGEAGELTNAVKKVLRHRINIRGNTEDIEAIKQNIREEIGDILITLDRLAEALGVDDVEECTRDKFNKTSKKVGIEVYL